MIRRTVAATVLALVSSHFAAAEPDHAFDPTTVRMVAAFHDVPSDVHERLARVGITHAAVFRAADSVAVVGPPAAYREIARWPEVAVVRPDVVLDTYMWQAVQTTNVDDVRLGVPPLDVPYTGRGVTVAVIDTGVDTTHPDLQGQGMTNLDFTPAAIFDPTDENEGPLISEPVETPVGVDPDHPHGTFVAGIVAGQPLPVLRAALQRLIAEGVVVVFPAGAPPGAPTAVTWPARYDEIIAAKGACKDGRGPSGPLDWTGAPSPEALRSSVCQPDGTFGSNRDAAIDVVTPAVDVWTPHPPHWPAGFYPLWRSTPPGGSALAELHNSVWYSPFISHSFAAAHVAGVAALMLEANPCLTQDVVETILQQTARDLGPVGPDVSSGFGMVDALGAVAAAEDIRGVTGC